MQIEFHKNFKKKYKKLRHQQQKKFEDRLRLLEINSFHPILNNHPLQGKYSDCRSIDVTGNLRAVFKLLDDDTMLFVDIDTHPNLYS